MITILSEKPKRNDELTFEEKKNLILWLSVSKTKTYLSCKSKFKKSYIERLPKLEKNYLIFGKFMHRVLELFIKALINNKSALLNEEMGKAFKLGWEEYKEKITEEQFVKGKKILANYLTKLHNAIANNTNPEFLDVEQEFYIDIDGIVLLNGSIDLIQRDPDGIIHVADYKSSKKESKKYLEKDLFQLKTYAFVLCIKDPTIEIVRTSYILFEDDMNPIIKEWTRKEAMSMEKEFLKYAASIKVEESFPPKTSPLCKVCDYLDTCIEGSKFVASLPDRTPARPGQQVSFFD